MTDHFFIKPHTPLLISLLSTELLSIRNQLTFIGHFPHAKLCSKCFSSIISVNPHSNLMKWEQLTQLKPIAICSLLDIFLFYKLPCTFISFCPDSVILPFSGNCSLPAQWLSLPQSSNILKVLKNLSPDHCFFGFPLSLLLLNHSQTSQKHLLVLISHHSLTSVFAV